MSHRGDRLSDRACTRARRVVGRDDRPTSGTCRRDCDIAGCAMNANRPLSWLLCTAVVLLAACAKPAPAPDGPRPVQLMQVKLGGSTSSSVFAGEVKPRHEIDLGFRIGGKVIGRSVDVGAHVA